MPKSEKWALGVSILESIDPTAYSGLQGLESRAPGLADSIVEFAFGDIANRGEVDLKTRELVTVSALLGMGGVQPQLASHIVYALRLGWTEVEIQEAIIHTAPVLGIPKAINGLAALTDAMATLEKRNEK